MSQPTLREMESLFLLLHLAISAGLCIIVGALDIKLKHEWGEPHISTMMMVLYLLLDYLIALVIASVQAERYPILCDYLLGC